MIPPQDDPAVALTDRERRDIRNRNAIGIIIAIAAVTGLGGYVAAAPHPYASVLLALGVIAGGALIAWIYRCSDGHEHQKLTGQNRAILARQEQILAAVEKTEHSVQGVHQRLGHVEEKLGKLAAENKHLREIVVESGGVPAGGIGPSPYS